MAASLLISCAAFLSLLAILRTDRLSLGLPLAYLGSLLLIHVPGAYVHLFGHGDLVGDHEVAVGIGYTALGVVCFTAGVWLARMQLARPVRPSAAPPPDLQRRFRLFCLLGGWLFVYGLSPLSRIPSLGAAIDKGGAIWMLGALIGLREAFASRDPKRVALWAAALMVYPALTLVLGGFLSYGSAALIVACSVLAITARSYGGSIVGIMIAALVGLNFFVNYFEHRESIRAQVWGGASFERKLDSVYEMFTDFHIVSRNNVDDFKALDVRLNQNFFIGLASERIKQHEASYLDGGSLWDGVLAVIPRALWPDKPIRAGSGRLVEDATGLRLSQTTSWGVGNVLEFYINFGVPGLIVGFLFLGWLLGRLDFLAAVAERRGDFEATIGLFLPAVALIQPGGSVVEMVGGAAAALVASFAWKRAWRIWRRSRGRSRPLGESSMAPSR